MNKEDFFDLVEALEYFSCIGFVHGDLNKKNILYTNEGFKIIDLEPSLHQVKHKIKQLIITMPYASKLDLDEKNISIRTDKIAFFYFILRVNKAFSAMEIVKLSKTLKHFKYLQLNEVQFMKLSYAEILERAYIYIGFNK